MGVDRLPRRWLFSGSQDTLLSAVTGAEPPEALEQAREYGILRDILEGTTAAVSVLDERLRYLYVNTAMSRMSGIPAAAFLGRTLTEVLPETRRSDEILGMVLADGQPRALTVTGTTRAPSPYRRRYWSMVYHRLEGDGQVLGLCGVGVEISGLRQYLDDLEKAHQRLALLDTAATRIGTTLDVDRTCTELAEFVTPSLADAAAVYVVDDEPMASAPSAPGLLGMRIAALTGDPDILRHVDRVGGVGHHFDISRGHPIHRSLVSGRPWLANLATDEVLRKMLRRPELVTALRAAHIHSLLFVPLPTRKRPVGGIYLGRSDGSTPFAEDDVVVAQDLAGRAAVAIDNACQYALEHTMALELQRALLSEPGSPHPDIEVPPAICPPAAAHSSAATGSTRSPCPGAAPCRSWAT